MTYRKYFDTLFYLYLFFILSVISADQACDKSKCKGPVKYYEDLKCTPIYGAGDTCCAVRYNCDHLKGRSPDKCYYKGHVYNINEDLRAEDAKPCDIGCTCSEGWHDAAHFQCAEVDCFGQPGFGCYLKQGHNECCDGPEVCLPPYGNDTVAECKVDGETYYDGQRFTPKSDPTLSCICSEGYTGQNVAPFCNPTVVESVSCDTELHHGTDVYNNCTPAFYSTQNPATDCNFFSRCQNKNDRIVRPENATEAEATSVSDPDFTCTFGQLTLKLGDQLNQGTHYSSVCLKCVCEVPPTPTCQRLPDNECDVTVHTNFEDISE